LDGYSDLSDVPAIAARVERTGTDRKLIGRRGRIGHTALYGTAWEALPGRPHVKARPALGFEVCYDRGTFKATL
jgi:hypothetical protein